MIGPRALVGGCLGALVALLRVAYSFAFGMSGQLNDFYAFTFTRLAGRWWLLALGVLGWLLIELQPQLDGARETAYQASPELAWLSSVGLYGPLILGGITAYVLLRPGSADGPADRDAHRQLDVGR